MLAELAIYKETKMAMAINKETSEFVGAMMRRDGMTEEQAVRAWHVADDAIRIMSEMESEGEAYTMIEDYLGRDWGLEPDYLMEFL